MKGNTGFVAAHQDSLDPDRPADQAQARDVEKGLGGRGEGAESVADFVADVVDGADLGSLFVGSRGSPRRSAN